MSHMLKLGIIGLFLITYFCIGYAFACWMSYRHGADKYVPGFMRWEPIQNMLVWPFCLIAATCCVIYEKLGEVKSLEKFSPDSFYDRGKLSNDIDHQAEKILLGKK